MPHLHVECSANLLTPPKTDELLRRIHLCLSGAPSLDMDRVKSRITLLPRVLMGVDAREVQIVHVVLSILEGRSSEVRSEYGRRIFEALRAFFPETESVKVSLTVEIREMDSQSYFKN